MVVKGYVKASLLIALVLFGFAGTADAAFYFRGYTYNETNVTLNNTNISIEAYTFGGTGPQLQGTDYNSSNATGFFNVSVTNDNPAFFYKIVIKHFVNNATTGTLDYIGQALPQFPQMMVSTLTVGSPMNFYLRRGGTININATNGTSNIAFKYMIKDTRLGYPITENFTTEQGNVTNLHVPLERNYSIMIFPNQSLPISYDLNNLSTYTNTNYIVNITFNTSIRPRWVSGYANLSDGSSNFTNLTIIAYLMEPGNIIGKDRPMPSNMSAFRGDGSSDTYNATNGSYNITLPGSAQGAGANILLFATAKNGSNYYGAFKNITMNYTGGNENNFNFTLHPLLGRAENISNLFNVGTGQSVNVTTLQLPFQLINGSGGPNITNKFAHIEIEVNYSANGSAAFKWMVDVSQSANGSFSIPAINANIGKINVFMQDFAPIKTSKNATQLATQPVNITMTSFDNKKPDGGELSGVFIDMLLSKPECDRPVPAAGCSLVPDPTNGTAEDSFDPFKIVLGGGKISLRIKQTSTRITVHYKNVDMLASGPPDALFDDSANQSQSGTALEQAWRFGSKGPEIYDEVLIGVPFSGMSVSKVYLGKLYDENWNATWNTSAGDTLTNLPSDYSTFNTTWFNSTTGMPCSTTDNSSSCYIDTTNGTLWLRIPHFSGVGPTVSSVVGNVTVNLTNGTGIAGRNVVMNFTVNDTVNATSFYNITFPSGFNASLAVVNITINGTVDPTNWNKTRGTLFVNVSRNGTHAANASVLQYINLSNVTIPSATGNHTINVTTNSSITVSVNYTVVAYNASLTNVSGYALTNNTTAGTNATYYLNLTNNGTATDSYTITVANPDNAYYYATNISTATLDAGQTSVFILNVTNTTASTVRVNVTATSVNDSTRFSYINTTTNVTGTVYGASLTLVTTASQTTNAGVNASYTLTLQNNNTLGLADAYNFTVANPDSASTFALNFTGNITLNASENRTIILNVTNTSSGVFRVNVTARSNNDSTKYSYINTTTTVPVIITIISPANGSTNTTGYVNVTATLDAQGWAQYLNWQGTNYSMTPSTPQNAGIVFYRNMTNLSLSGNYSFRIYANDSNANNASETRIITVNRTNTTSFAANITPGTFNVNTTINITSPSGNVTVTIPNGTNASISGASLTSVSIDSLAQVNSTFVTNLSSSDRFIGENLTLGPDGAQFSPDIQLNFSYTDAQLTAAGISESELRVKFYNTTNNSWVTQPTYSQNTAGNYIIVNVSHFSTFALLGTTTTTTPTGGGSSGSTGGAGVVSSEPFANIEKSERYDRNLIANSPVTYTFKVPEHGIYEIAVTGSASENDIAIRVEALKGTSKLVTLAPPGTAYKNLNILAGTKRIKGVLIRFKVENSWLTSNNLASSDVKLVKWDGSQWVQLETSEKTKDAGFTYFEAKTDGLSSFAITSLKGVAAPTATPAVQVTETGAPTATATPAPTAAPTEKAAGFELVLAAVTVCAAYLLGRKRR